MDTDEVSIVDMKRVDLADALKHYCVRSTTLWIITLQLLREAKFTDCIKSLKTIIKSDGGVLLMESICKLLLPLATTHILEVLTKIGLCMQKNGESDNYFPFRMENLFLQV